MKVALEMERSPFLLCDGAGIPQKEILRGGGWRKFILYDGGKLKGVCMGEAAGAAARFNRMGFRFFAAGTWQADKPVAPGLLPPILPEVLNVIHETEQTEIFNAELSDRRENL